MGTTIPTRKDRQQEDELRYFKFIHVLKAKLSAHGTVGFVHASRNSQLSLNEQLLKTMIEPLEPREKMEGYLFIFVADDAPGLCRISSTSGPPTLLQVLPAQADTRQRPWAAACEQSVTTGEVGPHRIVRIPAH